jgi:3-phenylpropionate/trans-cinnamate dioxygenase ferredoxin component
MGSFIRVALINEILPGHLLRVEVAGRLLCLVNVAGTVYAVDDDCTHIGGPLDRGELDGYVLTCPLHLAQFDVRTGEVLRGPAHEPLPVYQVMVEDDAILVEEPESWQSS